MAQRTLTANDLRKLAEAVDGVRDKPAYVVWGNDGPEVKTDRPVSGDVIFECVTNSATPTRTKIRSLTIEPSVVTSDGKPMTDFATRFDAMFWSEAAVEKFALPYYVRSSTPEQVNRIRKAFNHSNVLAMLHLPDSRSLLLTSVRSGNTVEALTLQEFEALL